MIGPAIRVSRTGLLVGALLVAALLLGYSYVAFAAPGRPARLEPPAVAAAATASHSMSAVSPAALAPAKPALDRTSKPVRVIVASIGVDSTLESLGLAKDGTLQSPSSYSRAGWYAKGVVPGSVGPAVIAGHVDSVAGPGVFFRLREVKVGDVITVQRQDGTSLRFVVDELQSFPKAQFPSAAVYGPTPLPELRLVTCTGDFDYRARSYLSNLVVSAHLS